MKKFTYIDTLEEILISILIIVLPITFLPLLYNGIDLPKQMLLAIVAIILLFILWIHMLLYKKHTFYVSLVTVFAGLLTLLSLLSIIIHPGNFFSSMLHQFGFITMASLLVIGSSIVSYIQRQEHKTHLIYMFLSSSIITGIISMLWILGQFLPSMTLLQLHPSGTLRAALVTQWIPFLLCLGLLMNNTSKRKNMVLLCGTILAGILASISLLLYIGRFQPITMPYTVGWQVALETLKSKPIQGAGVLNYEHIFTQARPSTLNVSPIWNIRFIIGPNILFHYITIFGIVGAIICLLWLTGLLITALKTKQGYIYPVLGIFAFFFLLPLDITFLFTGIILTAIITPILYKKAISLHQPLALLSLTMIIPSV